MTPERTPYHFDVSIEDPASRNYALRLERPDSSVHDGGFLTTRRKRRVGEIVNLPDGPHRRASPPPTGYSTKGHLWKVTAIEPHEEPLIEGTLVLRYERPHSLD